MADNISKADLGSVEQIETRKGIEEAPQWIRDLDVEELQVREKKLVRKIDFRL